MAPTTKHQSPTRVPDLHSQAAVLTVNTRSWSAQDRHRFRDDLVVWLAWHAVASCAILAGCGSNDDQMLSAVQESLAAYSESASFGGRACLQLPLADTVQPDSAGQPLPMFDDSRVTSALLRTLVSRGLLREETAGTRGARRFGLTPEGAKYLRHEAPVRNAAAWRWHWALCTGSMRVMKIESFTKPTELLGQTITSVNFRYAIDGAADWASDAQLQALDAQFARHFQQPVGRIELVQTNKGWRSIYMHQHEAGRVK